MGRLVGDGLSDIKNIGPGEIGGTHGDPFGDGIDIGNLVDVGGGIPAEEAENPLGDGLIAGDEAFGTQDARGWINGSG